MNMYKLARYTYKYIQTSNPKKCYYLLLKYSKYYYHNKQLTKKIKLYLLTDNNFVNILVVFTVNNRSNTFVEYIFAECNTED